MLSIGEFSRVTRLTIKALRLYHEKGLLVPDQVGESSSYRYYGPRAVERAGVIVRLKDMGFSLDEIKAILDDCRDDREIIARVEAKLAEVEQNIERLRAMKDHLEIFLQTTEGQAAKAAPAIAVETVPERLICGRRFRGRYAETGPQFGALYKACGRRAQGRPFSLYHDGEYKEEDADIEIAVEVREPVEGGGFSSRVLPGGTGVVLVHRGPYETLGRSYEKLFGYGRDKALTFRLPVREQYLKGPGIVLRGNPRHYLTRLTILFEA
jgi:DNA-binding transcriptional MerR regulator/effector-binding domain-containing protein